MVYCVSHFNRMIDNSRRNEANAQDIEVIAPHTYDLPWEDNGIKGHELPTAGHAHMGIDRVDRLPARVRAQSSRAGSGLYCDEHGG